MTIKKTCLLAFFMSEVALPAKAGIIDCTVILCLPSGFPAGCAAAQVYMLGRLKDLKPPFGTCEGSGIGSSGVATGLYCPSGVLYRSGGGRDEPVEYACSNGNRPIALNYGFKTKIENKPQYFYGTYDGGLFLKLDAPYRTRVIRSSPLGQNVHTGNNR